MSLLRRLFPKRNLADLEEPTRVRVTGTIASGAEITSAITGRTAPIIGWFVSQRYTIQGGGEGDHSGSKDGFSLLYSGCLAAPEVFVEVEGVRVHVESAELTVRLASGDWSGQPLDAELPAVYGRLGVDVTHHNIRYAERWLDLDDTVVLEATVRPLGGGSVETPYRSGGTTTHPRFATTGAVRLTDTVGHALQVRPGKLRNHSWLARLNN